MYYFLGNINVVMKIKLSLVIILGLLVGYYIFLPALELKPNPNPSKFKELDTAQIAVQKLKKTEPKANNFSPEPQSSGEPTATQMMPKEVAPEEAKIKPKDKKASSDTLFDPTKEVRYQIKEGYAVAAEDILLGKPKDPNQTVRQTLLKDEVQLWLNGEVPFALDKSITPSLKDAILEALTQFSEQTSIQFVPYSGTDKDFVVFTNSIDLCASFVGRVGGPQPILLSNKCTKTEIMHELMHTLGFIHEHQREGRDSILKINYQNIEKDKLINFDILPNSYQVIYRNESKTIDYASILIYPSNAFVIRPDLKSIEILGSKALIQDNRVLSVGDIEKIYNLYFRKF